MIGRRHVTDTMAQSDTHEDHDLVLLTISRPSQQAADVAVGISYPYRRGIKVHFCATEVVEQSSAKPTSVELQVLGFISANRLSRRWSCAEESAIGAGAKTL